MESILRVKFPVALIIFVLFAANIFAGESQALLQKGWAELVVDSDAQALKYFEQAYEKAKSENDTANVAAALLNMGICTYSVSFSEGMDYCLKSMDEFQKFDKSSPEKALEGRSRCLQLISTIKSRQGKFNESIALSKEAMAGFPSYNDTSGYLGLIYKSLGIAYGKLNNPDSSEFYHRKSLDEHLRTKNFTYQPMAFINVADIEMNHGKKELSRSYYDRALFISDSTGNRQSQVSSLLGIGNWYLHFENDVKNAELYFLKAQIIADGLSDKSFFLNTLEHLIELKKIEGDFKKALSYEQQRETIKDSLNSWDKEKAIRILEVQFDLREKERQLSYLQKEKDITSLTNYFLWATIGFLLVIAGGFILFLRRINKRDKSLFQAREALAISTREQEKLKEKQMQNELEFKESQLSAMTLQMLQKNELMQELKDQLENDNNESKNNTLNKIISKGLNHDKEWKDFDTHFESINKNFYSRLKSAYPEISPNDLKICALIKLNLSIKEMAGILNISPDSVKTARYRLRKKLQLNSEDNLTDFILHLE